MPVTRGGRPFDELSRRWHELAERRLVYFIELYRSGRWKRYYASEEQFAVRMLDVIRAAKTWASLAGRTSTHALASLASMRPALPTASGDDLRSAA